MITQPDAYTPVLYPSKGLPGKEPLSFDNATQFFDQLHALVCAFSLFLLSLLKTALWCFIIALTWLIPIPGTGPIATYYLKGYLEEAINDLMSSLYFLTTTTNDTFFNPNDRGLIDDCIEHVQAEYRVC